MAVVVDEFEATGEPADAAKGGETAARKAMPHDARRDLRAVAMRAARVWPR